MMKGGGSSVGGDRDRGGGRWVDITGVALSGGGKKILTGVASEVVPVVVGACAWWNLAVRK